MKRFSIILILCMSIIFTGCEKAHKFGDSNLIQIKNLATLNSKNITVYFGRPTCPNCSEFLPILESVLKDEKKEIYYFNTDDWRDNDRFESVLNSYNIERVPTIIKIKKDGSFEKMDLLESNIDLKNTNQVENTIRDFLKEESVYEK